jgi:hypothetical protein
VTHQGRTTITADTQALSDRLPLCDLRSRQPLDRPISNDSSAMVGQAPQEEGRPNSKKLRFHMIGNSYEFNCIVF